MDLEIPTLYVFTILKQEMGSLKAANMNIHSLISY